MSLSRMSSLFYFGTFLSYVGNYTFIISLVAFMVRDGYSLVEASSIVGTARFMPVLVGTFLGQLADKISAKHTIIVCELIASTVSVALLWAWGIGEEGYWYFFSLVVFRYIITSFQSGSRAKVTKYLGSSDYGSQSKQAIKFNSATEGATILAAAFSWMSLKYLNFETVIIFDMITFILNGLIIWFLPVANEKNDKASAVDILKKFKDLYRYNPVAVFMHIGLAVIIMGNSAFLSRLAGSDQSWFPIFASAYGIGTLLAGWLEAKKVLHKLGTSLWLFLGISFSCLGFIPELGWITWGTCLLKDVAFWVLYHRVTGYMQSDTPTEVYASVRHAFSAQFVAIVALGEILVGSWEPYVPIFADGLIRGLVCLVIAIFSAMLLSKRSTQDARPRL